MKLAFVKILLLSAVFVNAQTIQIGSNPKENLFISLGSSILVNGGRITNAILLPEAIPLNAYYLQPNGTGDFTKSMVESAVNAGNKYIVFDADTLNVDYADENHFIDEINYYIDLELVGTPEAPVTLDFRNVYINCFPDEADLLKKSAVFSVRNSDYVNFKFGTVEGDKFKRALNTDAETAFEQSYLVVSSFGTKNLTIEAGNLQGFMGDVVTGSPFGSAHIDTNPLANNYYAVGDNRYESGFYNVNPALYPDFGLTGGLGFNRLLYYDMEDVTFKFFNSSNTQIAEITGAQYFERYAFPNVAGIAKMKVNVRAMDGRTESPTNFGHNLQYNPNTGATIKNTLMADNHRGDISNIGANATIDNCEFVTNARYSTVPEFGTVTEPFSTRYRFNAEDVVSRNLVLSNNLFKDKFHKIILISNLNANVTNNTFEGTGNNISTNRLLSGTFSGNVFGTGEVTGGYGTNKSTVSITNNTGTPDITLSNGANWTNNTLSGGLISGKGKASNNTFTNYNFGGLDFTKETHTNNFVGYTGTPELQANDYVYKNNFTNVSFRIAENGLITDSVVLDSLVIDNRTNNALYVIDRYNTPMTVIVTDTELKGAKFKYATINEGIDYVEASWYFNNCTLTDIDDHLFYIGKNSANNVPVKLYFKNSTLSGSGDFIKNLFSGMTIELVLDNCTVDPLLNLPSYTTSTVTIPTITAPRTQPIPTITRNGTRTEIATAFHIMSLQIRNKTTSEIVLNEDVCSTYLHYNDTPSSFEYSIDGGVYWDEINN